MIAAPIRVLLVEDDEDDYLITRDLLTGQTRSRVTLDWHADFDAALAAIRARAHDVYLLDHRLGSRTGLELLRAGFPHGRREGAPVLMLTAQDSEAVDREAQALGASGFLLKRGLDPGALERAIRYTLRHHHRLGERIRSERLVRQRLAHDALHDPLTGLPNRILFEDRVGQTLARARRDRREGCAVLHVDLDRFKLVNDSLSHAVGDRLLAAIAERMAGALRPGDTVARIGGDEFTVLLEHVVEADEAIAAARRILDCLTRAFEVDGSELFARASVGVALSFPGLEPGELMRNADIAMYDAKRRGRGRLSVFDESMHRRVVDRLTRETELRQIVEDCLLGVHYQPIVDLATGRISGLEALARWPEAWSPVAPSEFIGLAEETGVISALGEQVLSRALAALAQWRAEGLVADDVGMSVNLSARQLEDPGWAERVRAAIASASLPPGALTLEITESTLMQEIERAQHAFGEMTDSGIGLHLDDFGTGFSSLSALHRFPVDALKIDRSFVAAMAGPAAEGGEVIVRSTVALAHSLGMPVIAEGIESPAQLRQLRELGCEYGQGFLFSRALDAARTRRLLQDWFPEAALALGDPA